MPYKNLEDRVLNSKKNYEKNKDEYNRKRRERYANDKEYREKKKIQDKIYYDKVKLKKNNPNYFKEHYQKNKDKYKEYQIKYRENTWIYNKKRNGIKFHMDPLKYKNDIYDKTYKCDFCNCEFEKNMKKCVEHHHISGYIRGIACHKCNMNLSVIDSKLTFVLLELHRFFNSTF